MKSIFELLWQHDRGAIEIPKKLSKTNKILGYEEALASVLELKQELVKRKEASELFGREIGQKFAAIINSIYQTFDGIELYPSFEEKAANLLYLTIKDHPFADGNKRIAVLLFTIFLHQNGYWLNEKGERKFSDNMLVAVALLLAESQPQQKDQLVKLIMNFLSE